MRKLSVPSTSQELDIGIQKMDNYCNCRDSYWIAPHHRNQPARQYKRHLDSVSDKQERQRATHQFRTVSITEEKEEEKEPERLKSR